MKIKEAMEFAVPIMNTDFLLYQHCINVAGIAYAAAKKLNIDAEKAFVGGLLHDYGKLAFVKITLSQGPGAIAFMDHPVLGYATLREVDEDAAIIAYMHHSYQRIPYPQVKEIEVPKDLEIYCQLISYIDKVEAFITRSEKSPANAIEIVDKFYPFDKNMRQAVKDVVTSVSMLRLT